MKQWWPWSAMPFGVIRLQWVRSSLQIIIQISWNLYSPISAWYAVTNHQRLPALISYCIAFIHITVMSHEHQDTLNHQQLACLLNSLPIPTKETSKLCITGPLWEELTNHRWIPLTKGQSYRKNFDVMTSSWKPVMRTCNLVIFLLTQ